MYGTELLTLS
jgi:hypothetical protein